MPDCAPAFDPQLERRQPGLPADLLGGDLVDRNPDTDAGSVGLEGMGAGQEAGQRPGVVAGPVAQGFRVMLGQARQDEQIVLEGASGWSVAGSVKLTSGFLGIQSGRWTPLGT